MLGILGGIAPGSTIDYYRAIVAAWRDRVRDGSYPAIVINSIDLKRMLDLVAAGDLGALADYLVAEMGRLERAGAEVGLMASNTPHLVFDQVRARSALPLLSIVEATRDAARDRSLRRVGLIGTRFTMEGCFYPEVFARAGIEVRVPEAGEQAEIHDRYVAELVSGVFRDETRQRVLAIAHRLVDRDGIEALILGGTELPLLLRGAPEPGVPFLDTTKIHVERAVAAMIE